MTSLRELQDQGQDRGGAGPAADRAPADRAAADRAPADRAAADRAPDETRTPENQAMLDQFYATLEVVLAGCREGEPDHDPAIAARVRALLDIAPPQRRWIDAYQADLYLSRIRPRASLRHELTAALEGLKRRLKRDETPYDDEVATALGTDLTDDANAPPARALLLRILSERHWRASQRNLKRRIGLAYAGRLFWALVATLAIFGTTIILTFRLGDWFDDIGWSYTGFAIAGSAGLVGAVFSMMTSHRGSLDPASIEEAQLIARARTIVLRIAIGGTAAIVLYFIFESGVIAGVAFPDLERLGFTPVTLTGENTRILGKLVPNAELCKLMVWSFLAGFSEKLVPRLLSRTEAGDGA